MPRGQQKVILPAEDLPPLSRLSNGSYGYIVRYRIISEDQNRYSHWSPIRELPAPPVSPVEGSLVINGNIAQLVWGDEEDRPNYDIFISFDGGGYIYHGTSSTHQYSLLIPYDTFSVQAKIQIESTNKIQSDLITIFTSAEEFLVELS
jgi:hypothetical protein